jgi:hypothetical protein
LDLAGKTTENWGLPDCYAGGGRKGKGRYGEQYHLSESRIRKLIDDHGLEQQVRGIDAHAEAV